MTIIESMDEGPFQEYFKDGTLKCKGSLKSGSYDGPFEEYYENGQLKEKCCFNKGLINGPYVDYFESGQLSFKYGYKLIPELEKPDYETDVSQFYHKFLYPSWNKHFLINLKKRFNEQFKYLRKIGFQELVNNDEIMFSEKIYDRTPYDCRNCESYYSNGQLKFQNRIENCGDSYWDSGVETFNLYYRSGRLKFKNTYDYADKSVNSELYYEDGQLKEKHDWEGSSEHYYKDGTLKENHRTVSSNCYIPLNTFEKYYTNGQLNYRLNLNGSRRHGPFELYDEHGEMIEKGSYSWDEIKDGPFEGYFEDGQLYRRCFYKNGLLEGSFEEYHPNGQLYRRCDYKNGLREGIFEEYYIFGKLNIKRNYVNGKDQENSQFIGFD